MSAFTPGDGWVTVVNGGKVPADPYLYDSATDRYWVRVDPVPPLPAEPWTVIRVTWRPEWAVPAGREVLVRTAHEWQDTSGGSYPLRLAERITGFEVLASPMVTEGTWTTLREGVRAETARAVLDRIRRVMSRAHVPDDVWPQVDLIASDFGVEAGS